MTSGARGPGRARALARLASRAAALSVGLALSGCSGSASIPADPFAAQAPSGARVVEDLIDLFPQAADVGDWRALEGRLVYSERIALQLIEHYKTTAVWVSLPEREVRFADLDAPRDTRLQFDLVCGPPSALGASSVLVDVAGRFSDGTQASWSGETALLGGGAAARVELPLTGAAAARDARLVQLELRFAPEDPAQVQRPDHAFGVIRPMLRFDRTLPAQARAPRQVILVTLDTLRTDHLGCYGHPTARSESLDALAADGARFESCFTAANVTNPSHASLFTSLYPKDHGVVDNFMGLAPEVPTLMDALKSQGFVTAGFAASGNFEPDRMGIDREFDDFFPCADYWERRAEDVNRDLFPWLVDHADQDFFAWIHYFDVHLPYAPPAPYDKLYSDVAEGEIELPLRAGEALQVYGGSRNLQDFKNRYLGELAYLDDRFGELVEHLKSLGVYERSLMLVTADHGEALGEYGIYCEHRSLHDVVTSVPLVIKPPGGRAAVGEPVVPGLVSLLDLLPTVCDYVDAPWTSRARGRSLRGLVEGRGGQGAATVYSEHTFSSQVSLRTNELRALLGLESHQHFPNYAIEAGRLELRPVRDGVELVDGPDVAADAAQAAQLRAELEAFLDDRAGFEARAIDSEEYRQRLRALGYTR